MKVRICPKCKSLNIRIRWQSFWFAGFPATYQCMNCGFKSFLFPKIEASEKNINKIIRHLKKEKRQKK